MQQRAVDMDRYDGKKIDSFNRMVNSFKLKKKNHCGNCDFANSDNAYLIIVSLRFTQLISRKNLCLKITCDSNYYLLLKNVHSSIPEKIEKVREPLLAHFHTTREMQTQNCTLNINYLNFEKTESVILKATFCQ